MREHSKLKTFNANKFSDNSIIVTLLNTRSYNKHKEDIKSDRILTESDVMCLTETQISPSSHCDSKLGTFTLIPNTDDDRFSSLFVGLRESVELIHFENCPGLMFFKLLKKNTP